MERKPLEIFRETANDAIVAVFLLLAPLYVVIFYRNELGSFFQQHTVLGIACVLVYFLLCIVVIKTASRDEPEIIVYDTGIWFDQSGFYTWDMIESFKTVRKKDEFTEDFLVLVFKEYKDLEVNISKLDKTSAQIADAILRYQSTGIVFTGHLLHPHD
jgi:hypothetical protein